MSTYCAELKAGEEYLWGIKFFSDNEEVLFEQNWFNFNQNEEWDHHKVADGNNVVGFYGDMDQSTITALGLIMVKFPD